MSSRFTEYNGVWLHTAEARALLDLESILDRRLPDISRNSMGSFGFIHNNYHIEELRLFQSYFQPSAQITELPQSIGDLPFMHTLDVSHNRISSLPSSILELEELEKFYLDYNQFKHFPKELTELYGLRQINFDENLLSSIPQDISEVKYLQSLHLAGNMFTRFPIELSNLRFLRRLDLSRNQIAMLNYQLLDQFSGLYVLDLRANPIPKSEVDKALAVLRLTGKKRRKYYLDKPLNQYEDPYSLQNISKRIKSDPHLEIDKSNAKAVENLALQIKKEYEQRS